MVQHCLSAYKSFKREFVYVANTYYVCTVQPFSQKFRSIGNKASNRVTKTICYGFFGSFGYSVYS